MKNIISLILIISISSILWSCDPKVDSEPIVIDFDMILTGEAPNAELTLTNNSQNGTSYLWLFSEGAEIEASTEKDPGKIMVDKVGLLTVILYVMNDTEEKSAEKSVSVFGYNPVDSFTDIEFAHNPAYGRFFSTETGQMYPDHKIDDTNGPLIDLAFVSIDNSVYYFESPDEEEFNIPGATHTLVMNYSNTELSIPGFDSITDDRLLRNLYIYDDDNSFGNNTIPHIILFQNDDGRKGAVKTKSINSNGLLVDIKVQRY